jgi:DNA-binding CsgD family transcriptional regulator
VWASRKTLSECLGKTITHVAAERGDGDVLSPREKEVLLFIARGKSDNEIAEELCISPFTVKTHLYRIFRKVSVTNRLQAALWAVKHL